MPAPSVRWACSTATSGTISTGSSMRRWATRPWAGCPQLSPTWAGSPSRRSAPRRRRRQPILRRVLDLVYKGQMRSVQVDYDPDSDGVASLKGRFEAEHRRLYGHIKPITPIRIAALRVVATLPASALAVPEREEGRRHAAARAATRRLFIDRRHGWADVPVYRGADLGAGHEIARSPGHRGTYDDALCRPRRSRQCRPGRQLHDRSEVTHG